MFTSAVVLPFSKNLDIYTISFALFMAFYAINRKCLIDNYCVEICRVSAKIKCGFSIISLRGGFCGNA